MNAYVREYQKIERLKLRRDRYLLRRLPVLAVVAALIIVGKIYVQSIALRWSGDMVEMHQNAHDLELENEELIRSITSLTTRQRVTRDAADDLGMVVPQPGDVLWLSVVDRRDARARDRMASTDQGTGATVVAWVDAFLQEEALALTSR